jgi:acetyltransferase-like isoleucine patch superfamily enzyme
VSIGDNCFIGAGSTIIPKINVGKNSIVAAGSVVIKDVPENVMVAGVPSKIKKNFL